MMTEKIESKVEFDSALTTLLQYGFSKVHIKRTLKDILNVYDGDEAWPLIKDNGYEVVIERLVSDDGPKRSKFRRKDAASVQSHAGLEKKKKQSNVDFDKKNKVHLVNSSNESLLAPILDLESAEVCLHQRNSWTRNGSYPAPSWFENASEKNLLQKFSHLHALLESQCKGRILKHEEPLNNGGTNSSEAERSKDKESKSAVLDMKKFVGAQLEQHDTVHGLLNTNEMKTSPGEQVREQNSKHRKRMSASQEVKYTKAAQTTASRVVKNMRQTHRASERLDIARLSACRLTRRKDGGPNPMFSRLQKCKQAVAGAQSNQRHRVVTSASQCKPDLFSGTCTLQELSSPGEAEQLEDQVRVQESLRLPPGFWGPSGTCTSQEPILQGRGEERQDPVISEESPKLPLGFWEQCDLVSPEESPKLPPGFWEPCGHCEPRSWSRTRPAEHCQERAKRSPSQSYPEIPPGFWKNSDKETGLRGPSGQNPGKKSPSLSVTSRCAKRNGTPPKQIFIANIPEGYEGAEQKLYSLVRELLVAFKSVPVSATLPRKIQVRGDHAFVEFSSEAVAGMFMDAYRANPLVLRIDGEQLVAARSLNLMKMDIQLRQAVAKRLQGQALDLNNVFYLGNVPIEWQDEERLVSHLSTLLEGAPGSSPISRALSVYTFPDFPDVYVHIACRLLADTFFLRCLSNRDHTEKISTSLLVCRNSAFLPRAAQVCIGPRSEQSLI